MMKKTFLLALGACALAGNTKAQPETVWQQMGRAMDTQAQVDVAREARQQQEGGQIVRAQQIQAQVALAAELRMQRAEAREIAQAKAEAEIAAQAAAQAKIEARNKILFPWFQVLAAQALIPRDRQMRGLYQDWLNHNRQSNDDAKKMFAVDSLSEGDPIPSIVNLYDDVATIRVYLHDSGYNDISDAQISDVRTYMHAHGIRHVSELGQ